VSMDRGLELPALVLLDEVGAGTDPVEGGALGTALIDHFRGRGAHLIATTHYDALKSYASTTQGVVGAAFGFNPETFAPTYRLLYGSPGRSLAIEIAARLGMPQTVISRARENLTEPQKQLADHLARVDDDLRRLEEDRRSLARERAVVAENEQRLRAREDSVAEREARLRRRTDAKLDDQLREARQQIDTVIETLKARAAELSDRAAVRLNASGKVRSAGLSTGDIGALKTDARAALDRVADSVKEREAASGPGPGATAAPAEIEPGSRVTVGALGLEGVVIEVHDKHAEVDVRGKRLRAVLRDLRPITGSPARAPVRVSVDLQPREGTLNELNLIGSTVDEAMDRLDKFFDQATVADVREFRIVHGHGTGQLRRTVANYLKDHPLVERFETAPEKQGGGGATIVYLKE
jgi:DNA mismatch repair protein MutS2